MENTIQKTIYHARGELQQEWSLWERQQSHNYNTDQLNEIFTFSNLKQLASFWRDCPHSNISDFLQLEEETVVKIKLYIKGEMKEMQIDCFMLFRKGIRPEWEDPKNHSGGHYLYQVKAPKREFVDTLWQNLYFDMIGEGWPGSEHICGLRVLNKVKGTDINFKVEIWFDIKEDTFSENHFKTKEEQDDLLALLKKKFLETINASYEEVKGTDPITKVVGISDIKFENHSSNHENTQKGHKKMGGGDRKYNDGKDRDRNRKWA